MPRILAPIVTTIRLIPVVARNDAGIRRYFDETFGGVKKLRLMILADFFRHAFDGSGADNFFDAGVRAYVYPIAFAHPRPLPDACLTCVIVSCICSDPINSSRRAVLTAA